MGEGMRKKLDVFISEDIREYISETAHKEGKYLYNVTEDFLRETIARRQGTVMEQQSLPVIREIVQQELLQAMTQQRLAWKEDMQHLIVEQVKTTARKGDDRIVSFLVRLLRDSGIIRRLVYALLLHFIGEKNALDVYHTAQERAGRDLARSPATEE
jgi:hypothetical protein